MKKNVMLKIASVLMVAVLLTTCAISSTFAKYVTTGGTVQNTAQVAKWGLTIEATSNDNNVFMKTYKNGSNIVANSSGEWKILAPGTKNGDKSFGFAISGKPEVAFNLNATVDVDLSGWSIGSTYYCPVEFWVGGEKVTVTVEQNQSLTEETYEAAIEAAIVAKIFGAGKSLETKNVDVEGKPMVKYTAVYPANYDFTGEGDAKIGDFAVTWEWKFDPTNAELGSGCVQTNDNDSKLGNQAAGLVEGVSAATISIYVAIDADQSSVGVAG
jgi:hypothetical protein